jgi:hypothetical protein
MRLAAVCALLIALAGCAYQMQLLPRDGGSLYVGSAQSDGMGGGTLNVQLDGRTCSGSFAQASSGNSFGFFQTYGRRGAGSAVGAFQAFGGSNTFKALMACTDGTGLRCDIEGREKTGVGICVDSKGRVFDMIYTRG